MAKSAGGVRYTKNAHFKGLLDEVRVYNRALSAEEVARHYRTTNLTRRVGLRPYVYAFSGEIIVELDLRGLGELPPGATVEVGLWKPGGAKPLVTRRVSPPAEVKLDAGNLPAGDYELRAIARDRNGKRPL
jgi:hypothetical protein